MTLQEIHKKLEDLTDLTWWSNIGQPMILSTFIEHRINNFHFEQKISIDLPEIENKSDLEILQLILKRIIENTV